VAFTWQHERTAKKTALVNYGECLGIAEIMGLLAFYAAGNYYVIQSLSAEMMGQAGPVAFGSCFWIWTLAMPFVYIGIGIKQKNVILLRTGLLLVTAAAITFRNYYHIMPVDIALVIIGAIILAIVYAVMKYLKNPRGGLTCAVPDQVNLLDQLKIESLIVAGTFPRAPAASTADSETFGGGDFGGGGSSGGF